VCTVVGFPLGANAVKVKVYEAELAIDEGATEIDMVINIGAVKTGNWQFVVDEVKAAMDACKKKNKAVIVKVIIETCLLNDDEIKEICRIQWIFAKKYNFLLTEY
jgi:deoxyribose-phosphate aldolase